MDKELLKRYRKSRLFRSFVKETGVLPAIAIASVLFLFGAVCFAAGIKDSMKGLIFTGLGVMAVSAPGGIIGVKISRSKQKAEYDELMRMTPEEYYALDSEIKKAKPLYHAIYLLDRYIYSKQGPMLIPYGEITGIRATQNEVGLAKNAGPAAAVSTSVVISDAAHKEHIILIQRSRDIRKIAKEYPKFAKEVERRRKLINS